MVSSALAPTFRTVSSSDDCLNDCTTGCVDADECAMEKDDCSENGFCENTHGSYNCVCKDGFEGNGQLCEDIDECAQMTHDCDENSSCENEDGSFSCKCLRKASI